MERSSETSGFLQRFAGVVLVCLFISVGLGVGVRIASVFTPAPVTPGNSEVLTVLLTGLTISLAVLAIIIAGLAVWGYGAIRTEARKIASQRAKKAADDYLKSDEMQEKMRDMLESFIDQEITRRFESREIANSQPLDGNDTIELAGGKGPVAKPYPENGGNRDAR